ncbi:DUF6602 domain-containing protein [Haloterrigena salifodinae]|uniref:DUF6602 domain-containing protein n=1 Tax=Haloterrigena salifodinae TaxID=2675099 RepID=UPI000F87BE6B|nr:DUF6602 domain-containing protein [Haloterrigena salifodinae]
MPPESEEIISDLLTGLRQKLRTQWREYRSQSYNQNTKGEAYEQALANLLTDYVGGAYDIRTRTAVIDDNLDCFELFTPAQNEIDVVATFPQATPQIVFQSQGMTWVPYHGVAFICEVKSRLTTTALRNDLEKTGKLQQIEREGSFGVTIGGNMTVNHQLKCLVYDDSSNVNEETMVEILEENLEAWDLVLLVEEDMIIAHPKLPFTETLENPLFMYTKSENKGSVLARNGLFWLLTYISVSIPHPPSLVTVNPLLQMLQNERFMELEDLTEENEE